ncbi:MAG TPA: dTDP-4-dehydrorhamnose 3,5-epimerase [Limnobacter sp.]|uniref:dTDP-4-dehydrorhamnose 3,5-epimerase n=1 Tax=Limnobacter sp. TaxID=2003368 RepID=UPI002E2FC5E7|nr:dTDP-4-dehydrorhamnose 3,5-epimerase [Limnobacter sp.]HEX5484698.1 dTDP-4-dehydrorhamnose 3,5-epimerase [Limnobacter sp.]
MKVRPANLPGLWVIQPTLYTDARGTFFERFNAMAFEKLTGEVPTFVQTCESHSTNANTLRGLHLQLAPKAQGKLVWVQQGAVKDVVVDVRPESPTFGQHEVLELSEKNGLQLWIPSGFAHGFLTLTDNTVFQYQVTDYYSPEHERCIAWNDPDLNVNWGVMGQPIVSEKDKKGMSWVDFKKSAQNQVRV